MQRLTVGHSSDYLIENGDNSFEGFSADIPPYFSFYLQKQPYKHSTSKT